MLDIEKWKNEIKIARMQKDAFFGSGHPQSPISGSDLLDFEELDYYPPNPQYRFEIELNEHKDKTTLSVQDTKGNVRRFIRWGEFHFKIDNTDCILQAYKTNQLEDQLFIPFRDITSGKETYGAGRYLDLKSDEHQTPNKKWIVDFNVAYNPWCAYSDYYACPYVPPENWLKVKIKAGEKTYPKE